MTSKQLPDDTYSAGGHDGQFVYVIPSLDLVVVRNGTYSRFDEAPVAKPTPFPNYPSDGLVPGQGTMPPDEWSDEELLAPIIDSLPSDN